MSAWSFQPESGYAVGFFRGREVRFSGERRAGGFVARPARVKEMALSDWMVSAFTGRKAQKRSLRAPRAAHVEQPQIFATIEGCLRQYGFETRVARCQEGPVVRTYEIELVGEQGKKLSGLLTLTDEVGMALRVSSVRIYIMHEKGTIGIEVPQESPRGVTLEEVVSGAAYQYALKNKKLSMALGKDSLGNDVIANLDDLPHLLIAGSTGQGKSVLLNVILLTLLKKHSPATLGLILIDPKIVELELYSEIPHLLHPVVIDPGVAKGVLMWACKEMDRRYMIMKAARCRSIDEYNKTADEPIKKIVIVVDELSNLIDVGGKETESAIVWLAQKARAAGMHLILATQRPDAETISGQIRDNLPARIALKVPKKESSKIILGEHGAERLLGKGDALALLPGSDKAQRLHCAFASDSTVKKICDQLAAQGSPQFDESLSEFLEESNKPEAASNSKHDEQYERAKAFVMEKDVVTGGELQTFLGCGAVRGGALMKQLQAEGIVGKYNGRTKNCPVIGRGIEQ